MREYNDRRDTNFQNYYYEQTKEASYIIPKMSEYEKNYIITKQFPWWVQEALASANFEDPNAIAHTLSNLDAIRSEKQARIESRSFGQTNNYNGPNQPNAPQAVEIRGIHTENRNPRRNNYNNQYFRRNSNNYRSNRNAQNQSNCANNYNNSENLSTLPDTRYPPPVIPSTYNPNNQNNNTNGINSGTNALN